MHSGDIGSRSPQQGEMEDCPCIHGNPFMHVMTELAEGDSEAASWKKRLVYCTVINNMYFFILGLLSADHTKTIC